MARNIIIFVADGLRFGSVNAIDTPTLFSIRQNGVNFAGSHSLFPTLSYPGVHAGFLPPGFVAIDLAHDLGSTLYDPNKPTDSVTQ
jgi:hypothetical protein